MREIRVYAINVCYTKKDIGKNFIDNLSTAIFNSMPLLTS